MDADDISLPTRLERQMDILRTNPACVLIGTAYAYITPSGHVIERVLTATSREVTRDHMAHSRMGFRKEHEGRFFNDPTVIFSRSVALKVGGYDTDFSIGDFPLWIRMLEHGNGYEIAEVHYLYRLAPSSMCRQADFSRETVAVRAKYFRNTSESDDLSGGPIQNQWSRLYALDVMCGDCLAARNDLQELERESGFGCNIAIRRALLKLSWLAAALMRYRMRKVYRYDRRRDQNYQRVIETYQH